ncbi:hypothetical protein M514_05470 [Trichuris suis]|uniref:Tetraspanin n=1 Tax=Trichuris suis TaxID=68888 RepID=A0A085M8K8_9BILA|nr:hypothetical protein M513_05470 [Trichuris suis]KFD69674.1 hypothetical protein M514_05470 [Trichuris suis]KHJ46981.1 tetraspanin family protein [Trichuris suis]
MLKQLCMRKSVSTGLKKMPVNWSALRDLRLTTAFVKSFLLVFNIITLALGVASLGVGIWLYVEKTDFSELTSHAFGAYSAAALFGAAGAAIIVVGFIGCCGTWVENRCLLIIYIVLVILLFITELTASILAFIYINEVTEAVRQELYNHLQSPYVAERARDTNGLRITWNSLQIKFKCCGVEGYRDWFKSVHNPQNNWVPDSCCDPRKFHLNGSMQNCGRMGNPEIWFQGGCYQPFSNWLLEHMHLVSIMGVVLACLQIFGLIVSLYFYGKILLSKRGSTRTVGYRVCKGFEKDSLDEY